MIAEHPFRSTAVQLVHDIRRTGASLLAAIGLAAGIFASPAAAQDTATVRMQTAMIERLMLINTRDLDFGLIIPGNSPGTVTVRQDSSVVTTGPVIANIAPAHPAYFSGYGRFNRIVSIAVAQNQIALTSSGGGQPMQVTAFTIASNPPTTLSTNPRYFRIGARNGQFNFNVGATLNVNAAQEPGVYTGTFEVIIEYY